MKQIICITIFNYYGIEFILYFKKEISGLGWCTEEFYQKFKKELTPTIYNLFQNIEEEEIFPIHCIKPALQNQILITKSKIIPKKENYTSTVFLMNKDAQTEFINIFKLLT